MKRFLALFIVCIMMMSFIITPTHAAEDSLQWSYIIEEFDTLDFDGNTGIYTFYINCDRDEVIEIEATATLYYVTARGNWSEMATWHHSVEHCVMAFDEFFTGVSGREYVVVVDATVYTDDDSESIHFTVSNVCP